MRTANISVNNIIPKNNILNTDNKEIEVLDSLAIYESFDENSGRKKVLTLNLVGKTPAHLKGWELVRQRKLMTVGISIGNGYFNRERLEIILSGMFHYFSKLVVIIPDISALHSYRALGYSESLALKKIKERRNKISNMCNTIISKAQPDNIEKFRILTWQDDFSQQNYYREAYKRAVEMYQSNPEFRESVRRNTEHYILARLEDQDIQQLGGMKSVVEKAVHYLLEEMAFHEVSYTIFGEDIIASYYKELELATGYITGKYGNTLNKHFGWIVYNIIDSE